MRISPMPRVCFGLLCGLLILIAGCGSPSSQTLDSLTITATPSTVSVGGAAVLKAVAHLSDGTTQDVTAGTQWTLSNTALATMSSNALTAKAPGSLTVQAAYVEATPAGNSPASATVTPETLTASTQVTITAAGSSNVPVITWNTPAAISYGTALSSTQLSATANVPGTFVYTPAAGTVLKAGKQTLSAVFTPTNTQTYSAATASVQLTVNQATPSITWATPAPIPVGTALSTTQLAATANVPGTFMYSPAAGAVLAAGTQQLTAVFSPTDATDYASATAHASLVVGSPSSGPTSGPTSPTSPVGGPVPVGCGGPTINVNSGISPSTLQSTINSAPNCAVIVFAAGTYGPITSTITIPCGVSLSGPTVPYSQTPNQTATINGSSSFIGWGFQTTAGCSSSQTIQYLAWNGGLPSNGGGFLNIVPGTTNLIVQNNWLHGVNAPGASTGEYNNQADLIFFNGGSNSPATSNVLIQKNILGSTSFADCATAMNDTSGDEDDNGGGCGGVGIHTNVANVTITNNIFHWLEEPMKTFESQGECNPLTVEYNDYSHYSRIAYETQCGLSGTVLMYIDYNDWHDRYSPGVQTYDLSAANGCVTPDPTNCVTHSDYNLDIANIANSANVGFEIWGGNGTTASYNLFEGGMYNAITWSQNGNFTFNYNDFNMSIGGSQNCDAPETGYFNNEAGNVNQGFVPSCTGNTFSTVGTGTTPSVAPTISPAGGTFSGSQVVTITNSGTNRDTNTTDWCTTDGSTPTPGSGTAVGYFNGGTLTVTGSTTVKCVGMWGALNQPYSYPSGYGYVPSAVVGTSLTAALAPARAASKASPANAASEAVSSISRQAAPAATSPLAPTLQSVTITPSQPVVSIGSTTQLKATATFSDGSVKDITSEVAWQSSDPRTITTSAAGILSGLATGPAAISGSYQGIHASASATSSIGQVDWSGPIVITEQGTYSGNWQSTDSKTPAVTVATTAPVVIENSHIRSVAGLIKTSVAGSNLTVRNSVGVALNPAVKGQPNGVFLDASSPMRLDVENNYIENARGGVLVHGYSGNRDGQETIVIRANRARNLNGLLSDGNGGYLPGAGSNRSVSRFIEMDKVQAVPGIDLGWNEVINYPGRSLVADNIDVKRSGGTPNQPLEIHDTYIQGAYPYKAAQADYDGGGIKTEGSPDDSAQDAPAFNDVHDNQVVGTVNYGIEFAAGHDNIAFNNRVISSGLLADGTRIAAQHVGMANGDVNGTGVTNGNMYNNTMRDNLIGWTCWSSSCSQEGYRKDQSFPASPGDYSSNSVLAAQPITLEMENNEYQLWLNKMASAGIAVGPTF